MHTIDLPELMAFIGFCIIIPTAALILGYLARRLRTQERLRAIEKGIPIPQTADDPWVAIARIRTAGIVCLALGIGGLVLSSIQHKHQGIGASAVPICLGFGLLLDYRLRARDLKARQQ